MIDTDKYEGHTPGPWEWWNDYISEAYGDESHIVKMEYNYNPADAILITDTPDLLAEVKRLSNGIRSILSDYDITELIRDVPEDEWNFEQQALVRMKELIE